MENDIGKDYAGVVSSIVLLHYVDQYLTVVLTGMVPKQSLLVRQILQTLEISKVLFRGALSLGLSTETYLPLNPFPKEQCKP